MSIRSQIPLPVKRTLAGLLAAPRTAAVAAHGSVITALLRLRGVRVGAGCRFLGSPRISLLRRNSIVIADRVTICSDLRGSAISQGLPTVLTTVTPDAVLVIEQGVGMSSSVIAAADHRHWPQHCHRRWLPDHRLGLSPNMPRVPRPERCRAPPTGEDWTQVLPRRPLDSPQRSGSRRGVCGGCGVRGDIRDLSPR